MSLAGQRGNAMPIGGNSNGRQAGLSAPHDRQFHTAPFHPHLSFIHRDK